jgi:energy-coupling factor transporter transmembrane protein EcfT
VLNSLHPATRLVGWIALIVFVQLARGPLLWGFGLVVVTLGLSFARQRSLRLVRRARFLLIVLVVLFAFLHLARRWFRRSDRLGRRVRA